MNKRLGKRDILLLLILLAVLLVFLFTFYLRKRENGGDVTVTVDGTVYGVYSLSDEQEIPIRINGTVTNTLVISDGKADMISADCPDKLCVYQKAIDAKGETIVCLPNKVVVEVTAGEQAELDTIAK